MGPIIVCDILSYDCATMSGEALLLYNIAIQIERHSTVEWTGEEISEAMGKFEQDLDDIEGRE